MRHLIVPFCSVGFIVGLLSLIIFWDNFTTKIPMIIYTSFCLVGLCYGILKYRSLKNDKTNDKK